MPGAVPVSGREAVPDPTGGPGRVARAGASPAEARRGTVPVTPAPADPRVSAEAVPRLQGRRGAAVGRTKVSGTCSRARGSHTDWSN